MSADMNGKAISIQLDQRYKEGPIFTIMSYLVTLIVVVIPFGFFMRFLNRVKIIGKEHLDRARLPFLFISNHVTMLDDMFIGPLIFVPRGFFNFNFMPYHTPEQKNFYLGPIVSWVMEHLKCIPLTRGEGINQPGITSIIEKLKGGSSVQIYPEGTRTRSGKLGRGKPGVGKIVYETHCQVVPCYHSGLEKVLPIGSKIPRPFKEVTIIIGEPIKFDRFFHQQNNIETWREIAEAMVDSIRQLREWGKRQGWI